MKVFVFAILFAAVFAANEPPPQCNQSSGKGLTPVIQEFLNLIPTEKILNIFLAYISNDKEVQEIMEYISSDDFIKIVTAVQGAKEFPRILKESCETLYLDADYYLTHFADILDKPKTLYNKRTPRGVGLRGMIDEILVLLPVPELKALLDEKLTSDKFYQLSIKLLKSDDFVNIVGIVTKTPEYKFVESELRRMMGITIDAVIEFLQKHLRWK